MTHHSSNGHLGTPHDGGETAAMRDVNQAPAMRAPASSTAMPASAYRGRGSTDYIGVFNDAIRDNPLAAALIGMGAMWMFMGGNRMSLAGGKGRRSVIRAAARQGEELSHTAARAASRVGEAVSSAASSVGDTVSNTTHRMGEFAGRMTHSREDDDYRRSMMDRDDYEDYGSRRRIWNDDYSRNGESTVSRLQENFQDLFERHPMVLGLAGLALGAGIAASIPVTLKERETLGRANDALRQTVKEGVSQAKEMAQAAAEEVAGSGSGTTGTGGGASGIR
jgi:hypothetical protein